MLTGGKPTVDIRRRISRNGIDYPPRIDGYRIRPANSGGNRNENTVTIRVVNTVADKNYILPITERFLIEPDCIERRADTMEKGRNKKEQ